MTLAIEHRMNLFAGLHKNKWFMVFNWVLDSMLLKDKENLYMHTHFARVFYN